jgi:NAD-dependent dihydropyrimidine dehydrogenase PreA subunit
MAKGQFLGLRYPMMSRGSVIKRGAVSVKRATVNFWIDAVIAVAFLLSAVTGTLFLLPLTWRSVSAAGGATIFGMGIAGLHTVHDWSGVVAAVGVIVHSVLHVRWFVGMARRLAHGEGRAVRTVTQSPPARRSDGTPAPIPSAAAVIAAKSVDGGRLSRRTFLVGLGTAVGALAFVGAASALRAGEANGTRFADAQSGWSDSSQTQGGNGWQGGGQGDGGANPAGGSGSSGAVGTETVVVDGAACIGCGRCLEVCPYGVFAWSGDGKATAQNPEACRLCGHCVRVCPANAITLSA